MNPDKNGKKIILTANLQGFFFEGLYELNKKSLCPVPESTLFYSSEVLDKFALSDHFFEINDGKVREKVLGVKLLEATQLTREEQKRVYKEVGDMSLLVCGYFSESVNKKIVDLNYYAQLGKMAYSNLNHVMPNFMDIPSFYNVLATSFESITTLMTILANKSRRGEDYNLVFKKILNDENVTEKELMVSGVHLPLTKLNS
ncbi:MAG: hypothetical protein AB7I27_14400 [Bacteriovoracaceae bacterium]